MRASACSRGNSLRHWKILAYGGGDRSCELVDAGAHADPAHRIGGREFQRQINRLPSPHMKYRLRVRTVGHANYPNGGLSLERARRKQHHEAERDSHQGSCLETNAAGKSAEN